MRLKINSEWRLMQYGLTLTPALLSKEFVEALALFCRFEFATWKIIFSHLKVIMTNPFFDPSICSLSSETLVCETCSIAGICMILTLVII